MIPTHIFTNVGEFLDIAISRQNFVQMQNKTLRLVVISDFWIFVVEVLYWLEINMM